MEIRNRRQYTAAILRSMKIHDDPYAREELREIVKAIDKYLDFNKLRHTDYERKLEDE